jgi:hypothetical protein
MFQCQPERIKVEVKLGIRELILFFKKHCMVVVVLEFFFRAHYYF